MTAGKVANSATSATSANNANAIVLRDGSGNFSAGTITANITGNTSGTSLNVTGIVTETHGGTNQSSYAIGDMLYASGANTLSKRTIGSSGNVLSVSSGLPAWSDLSTMAVTSAIGTVNQVLINGDLMSHNGAVTFSLPQSIGTTSSPVFAALSRTSPARLVLPSSRGLSPAIR